MVCLVGTFSSNFYFLSCFFFLLFLTFFFVSTYFLLTPFVNITSHFEFFSSQAYLGLTKFI